MTDVSAQTATDLVTATAHLQLLVNQAQDAIAAVVFDPLDDPDEPIMFLSEAHSRLTRAANFVSDILDSVEGLV